MLGRSAPGELVDVLGRSLADGTSCRPGIAAPMWPVSRPRGCQKMVATTPPAPTRDGTTLRRRPRAVDRGCHRGRGVAAFDRRSDSDRHARGAACAWSPTSPGQRLRGLLAAMIRGQEGGGRRLTAVQAAFVLAIVATVAFAFTNGFHDAANAIATLVATRGASPGAAIALAAVFNLLGPLLLGAAVANTIGTIVDVPAAQTVEVVGAALTAAVTWNVITWRRGLPSSSSHALVGGLVGAGVVEVGIGAVNWGGVGGGHPTGVIGALVALAISPVLGFGAAWAMERAVRRGLRRVTTRANRPVLRAQWLTSGWLAFSHGANDAQKAVGVLAVLLLANGTTRSLAVPVWTKLACAAALTAGTALGGWRIVKTIGRRIFRIRPVDGLVSQTSSAAVILVASLLGAPASTTQVVSSSVVGVGVGRRRYRHVGWGVVRSILLAWVITLPAAALLAALLVPVWRWLP